MQQSTSKPIFRSCNGCALVCLGNINKAGNAVFRYFVKEPDSVCLIGNICSQ